MKRKKLILVSSLCLITGLALCTVTWLIRKDSLFESLENTEIPALAGRIPDQPNLIDHSDIVDEQDHPDHLDHPDQSDQPEPVDEQDEFFASIDLSFHAAEIELCSGDSFQAEFEDWKKRPVMEVNGNTLTCKDFSEGSSTLIGQVTPRVRLTVPEGVSRIHVENALGSVRISGLSLKELDVDCSAGDVVIENCTIDQADCNLELGNFTFSGDIRSSMDLDCSAGNAVISLASPASSYDFEVDCDLGQTEHPHGNHGAIPIHAEMDLGNIQISTADQ